jgi:hypothetical protein
MSQAPDASTGGVVYAPPPSLAGYFTADQFINLVTGPVGSAKTSASIMKIAYEASRVARCRDGVRRSRCVVVRNTSQMLSDAFLPDFFQWYPEGMAGSFMRTERKFTLRFGGVNNQVECEVLFRGLDGPDDVRRLLSLQLSFALMDEFREIHPDVFNAITGRLGRYPNKAMNGVGCVDDDGRDIKKLWGATNPPDMDTWWEEYLTDPPKNAAVFAQPSGLSDEADWLGWLPNGYYDNLCEGKTQDWIDVYVHGKFGASLSGRPVFPTFDVNYHVGKEALKPVVSLNNPLIIGMDFGLTPACVVGQLDLRGRFLIHAELTSENMGITRFIREKLKPLLANRFPGHPVIVIGDPAGSQRAQTDERSVFDVVKAEGFRIIPARTNALAARISAVESLLGMQVDGGPRFVVDPGCRALIRALRGGYRYKIKRDGEMIDTPDKNEHSHIADSLQYGCLHIDATFGSVLKERRKREFKLQHAAGWT